MEQKTQKTQKPRTRERKPAISLRTIRKGDCIVGERKGVIFMGRVMDPDPTVSKEYKCIVTSAMHCHRSDYNIAEGDVLLVKNSEITQLIHTEFTKGDPPAYRIVIRNGSVSSIERVDGDIEPVPFLIIDEDQHTTEVYDVGPHFFRLRMK